MDYRFSEQSRLIRQIFLQAYQMELTDLQLHYIDTVYYMERQVKIYDVDIYRSWGSLFCWILLAASAWITSANGWVSWPATLLVAYEIYHLYTVKRMYRILKEENKKHLAVYGVK